MIEDDDIVVAPEAEIILPGMSTPLPPLEEAGWKDNEIAKIANDEGADAAFLEWWNSPSSPKGPALLRKYNAHLDRHRKQV